MAGYEAGRSHCSKSLVLCAIRVNTITVRIRLMQHVEYCVHRAWEINIVCSTGLQLRKRVSQAKIASGHGLILIDTNKHVKGIPRPVMNTLGLYAQRILHCSYLG